MNNRFNYVIIGLINQPQIWIERRAEQITTAINYLLLGVINQPQLKMKYKEGTMDTETTPTEANDHKVNVRVQGGSSGAVYGLGIIGACVYYINRGTTPQEKFLGFLKALVWPAYMVYELLVFLHKD